MGRAFEYRKARKMKRWDAMAKAFTRVGKEISMAVKSGGPDPETNARLRAAIQNAKSVNMPKDNVERAIKKASSTDMEDFKEAVFEGYAPHGIAVLIETATDNNQRTVANIRSYFNKCNGSLGTSGSVSFLFNHQCYFRIEKGELDEEELELELIDYGAEEVFVDKDEETEEEQIVIYAAFENYGALQSHLEGNSFEIKSSGFDRIPTITKEVNEEERADIEKLLDKIEDDDDVQNVFHTMA